MITETTPLRTKILIAVAALVVLAVLWLVFGQRVGPAIKSATTSINSSLDGDSAAVQTATSTYFSTGVVSHTNGKYGFSFRYPVGWKLTVSDDKRQVTIDSRIDSGVKGPDGKPISALKIVIRGIEPSEFGKQQTKYGNIVYDAAKQSLVDIGSTPARCLPASYGNLGLVPNIVAPSKVAYPSIPSYAYSGSLMSSPAYKRSIILTNRSYLIDVAVEQEGLTDEAAYDKLREDEGKLFGSFRLVGGVEARNAGCLGK